MRFIGGKSLMLNQIDSVIRENIDDEIYQGIVNYIITK